MTHAIDVLTREGRPYLYDGGAYPDFAHVYARRGRADTPTLSTSICTNGQRHRLVLAYNLALELTRQGFDAVIVVTNDGPTTLGASLDWNRGGTRSC